MLLFLKNHLNYLKEFKKYKRLFIFLKKLFFFSQHIMMESLSLKEEKIIKDIRNIFRLKENKATLQLKI